MKAIFEKITKYSDGKFLIFSFCAIISSLGSLKIVIKTVGANGAGPGYNFLMSRK